MIRPAGGIDARQRVEGAAGFRPEAAETWTRSCWWAVPPARRWCSTCWRSGRGSSRARTCIRTCASRWAPGVLASRLAGRDVDRVLVDVSPYSFGISFLGERGGVPYPHCYKPIIRRNTPLPLTRTERFYTSHPFQTEVDVQVYQGDDEDALKNILVGDFTIEGLTEMEDLNEILCRMRLDLDGILEVTALEKSTGKSKQITIANAMQAKTPEEIAAGRKRIQDLFESRSERRRRFRRRLPGEETDAAITEGEFQEMESGGAVAERRGGGRSRRRRV